VATGELLMREGAPLAIYADHDDIRLTDDGRFLVVAGGKAAHRWEIPRAASKDPPRKTDAWALNPAFSNRLAITPDGRILLCRNETRSGKDYPLSRNPPTQDPRCLGIYELLPGGKPREIGRPDDHPWHCYEIHPAPDGSCFIAEGISTRDKKSYSLVAYEGISGKTLWQTPLPNMVFDGAGCLDSTGRLFHFGNEKDGHWLRDPTKGKPSDQPADPWLRLAVGRRYAFANDGYNPGLRLRLFDAAEPFLVLDPDQHRVRYTLSRFTPDGRFVIWGLDDGSVKVADLPRIREQLVGAGFPGW
jgi:hypothetical protein